MAPSEVLLQKSYKKDFLKTFGDSYHCFYLEDWVFKWDYAYETLNAHFDTNTLKGFGVEHLSEGIISAGAVLYYLGETQHHKLQHITAITRIAEDEYVWMDRFTIRNLELYHSTAQNAVTLLEVIDQTISPMGGRMLKRWLALPLKNAEKIVARHKVVAYLIENRPQLDKIRQHIKQISDLERLISKVATGRICPREVIHLKNSLEAIVPIKSLAANCEEEALKVLGDKLQSCEMLRSKIKETLNEDAPVNILKGECIAKGFFSELDELRKIAFSGKDYLDTMLERETKATGITSLKIGSNNVYGYYIEVRNTHKDKVPDTWIRKQTLVNAERYITEELKEYEAKILGAEEKIQQLEQDLFAKLVTWLAGYVEPVQLNARLIGELDCLCSFAKQAISENYNEPEIDESSDTRD